MLEKCRVSIASTYTQLTTKRTIHATLVGICLGAGFVWPLLWWLSIIGIIALFLQSVHSAGSKDIIVTFFIAWWTKYLFAFSFILSTYPLTWLGVEEGVLQLLMLGVFWITCALWLAFGGVIAGVAVALTQKYAAHLLGLAFPVIWLIGEIAAPFFFSLFLYGDGGTININFSFGMVGYLFAHTALGVWLAAWFGVYGLTLLWVGVATVAAVFLQMETQHVRKVAIAACGLFLIAIVSVVVSSPERSPSTRSVIVINTEFDNSFRTPTGHAAKRDVMHEAVTQNMALGADFIITPEDSRYLNYQYGDMSEEFNRQMARFTLPQTNTVIIDSGNTQLNDHSVLRGYILDFARSEIYSFDKQYLVPQGEFVPYLYGNLFTAIGFGSAIDRIKEELSYQPSEFRDQSILPLRYPSIMFCFESINPRSAYQFAKRGDIPFVAHPVSHAWFNTPTVLWQQQDIMLQVQARWSGVPIVSAGNMLQGKAYLPDGSITYGSVISSGPLWEARLIEF